MTDELVDRVAEALAPFVPATAYRPSAARAAIAAMPELSALQDKIRRLEEALKAIARIRTDLRGDFSLASKQSDIARSILSDKGED